MEPGHTRKVQALRRRSRTKRHSTWEHSTPDQCDKKTRARSMCKTCGKTATHTETPHEDVGESSEKQAHRGANKNESHAQHHHKREQEGREAKGGGAEGRKGEGGGHEQGGETG